MKQITIYDLLPLLKPGWIAMEPDGQWWWYKEKPGLKKTGWIWEGDKYCPIVDMLFNIAPFDGDWKDSLMEVK